MQLPICMSLSVIEIPKNIRLQYVFFLKGCHCSSIGLEIKYTFCLWVVIVFLLVMRKLMLSSFGSVLLNLWIKNGYNSEFCYHWTLQSLNMTLRVLLCAYSVCSVCSTAQNFLRAESGSLMKDLVYCVVNDEPLSFS